MYPVRKKKIILSEGSLKENSHLTSSCHISIIPFDPYVQVLSPDVKVMFQPNVWKQMDPVKRIWYLSPMRAAKVQASLRIGAVSPEPSLLAHTSSESRGTFRQKARSLASLNGWACAVKSCHAGMLEDTNSLDGAQLKIATNCTYFACQISTDADLKVLHTYAALHAKTRDNKNKRSGGV